MPKVSVIVPVYGVEKYIERCACSLFSQTLDDIEFIFVDDCTPDRSIEILNAIIEKYRLRFAEMNYSVRIENMPTNSGLPAVRRHGIQLASGDYIIHCDSDDWVERDMYRLMYEKAKNDNADVVVCDYYASDIANKTLYKGVDSSCTNLISDILARKAPASLWIRMVSRKIYAREDIIYPQGNMGEDCVLSIQYLVHAGKRITYVPEPLYYYYQNNMSICGKKDETSIVNKFRQAVKNTEIIGSFLKSVGLEKKYGIELTYYKYIQKGFLSPILANYNYYKLWVSTFPEINTRIICSKYMDLKSKVKYLLVMIRLRKRI